MEQWNFDNPYQLPSSAAAVMPQELSTDFFSSLDRMLQMQEKKASENIYGQMEGRGLLNSGINTKAITEEVLGPGLQRRQQAFLPFAFDAAATGQKQRFQKEQQQQEFMNRLEMMREENLLNMRLANFQMQLQQQMPRSGGGFDWGGLGGMVAGGALGSFLGPMGAMAGSQLGGSLFSGSAGGGGLFSSGTSKIASSGGGGFGSTGGFGP